MLGAAVGIARAIGSVFRLTRIVGRLAPRIGAAARTSVRVAGQGAKVAGRGARAAGRGARASLRAAGRGLSRVKGLTRGAALASLGFFASKFEDLMKKNEEDSQSESDSDSNDEQRGEEEKAKGDNPLSSIDFSSIMKAVSNLPVIANVTNGNLIGAGGDPSPQSGFMEIITQNALELDLNKDNDFVVPSKTNIKVQSDDISGIRTALLRVASNLDFLNKQIATQKKINQITDDRITNIVKQLKIASDIERRQQLEDKRKEDEDDAESRGKLEAAKDAIAKRASAIGDGLKTGLMAVLTSAGVFAVGTYMQRFADYIDSEEDSDEEAMDAEQEMSDEDAERIADMDAAHRELNELANELEYYDNEEHDDEVLSEDKWWGQLTNDVLFENDGIQGNINRVSMATGLTALGGAGLSYFGTGMLATAGAGITAVAAPIAGVAAAAGGGYALGTLLYERGGGKEYFQRVGDRAIAGRSLDIHSGTSKEMMRRKYGNKEGVTLLGDLLGEGAFDLAENPRDIIAFFRDNVEDMQQYFQLDSEYSEKFGRPLSVALGDVLGTNGAESIFEVIATPSEEREQLRGAWPIVTGVINRTENDTRIREQRLLEQFRLNDPVSGNYKIDRVAVNTLTESGEITPMMLQSIIDSGNIDSSDESFLQMKIENMSSVLMDENSIETSEFVTQQNIQPIIMPMPMQTTQRSASTPMGNLPSGQDTPPEGPSPTPHMSTNDSYAQMSNFS